MKTYREKQPDQGIAQEGRQPPRAEKGLDAGHEQPKKTDETWIVEKFVPCPFTHERRQETEGQQAIDQVLVQTKTPEARTLFSVETLGDQRQGLAKLLDRLFQVNAIPDFLIEVGGQIFTEKPLVQTFLKPLEGSL